MIGTLLEKLLVVVGVDLSDLGDGMRGATQDVDRAADQMKRSFEDVGRSFQKTGLALSASITAPIMGAAALATSAINDMAGEVKQIERQAQLAGAGFEEFQRASYAALVGAGVESEKFGDILKDTADKIGDFAATGGGEMKDFFENIAAPQGLTVGDFLGKSSIEQLQMYVSALQAAGVSSEEMVFYLESIADEGSLLAPILSENGRLLDELGAKATIITPEAQAELKAYSNAQTELSNAMREVVVALVESGVANMLAQAAIAGAEMIKTFADFSPVGTQIAIVVAGLAAAFGPFLMALGTLLTTLPQIVSGFKLVKGVMLPLMTNPALLAFAAVLAGIYLAWKNWDQITAIVKNLYTGVKTWLQDKLGAVFDWVGKKITTVKGFFEDLYIAVVGNSYIPDMVDEIGQNMARLQSLMVDPAERATTATKDAFRGLAGEVSSLLDQLFPVQAQLRAIMDDMALLERGRAAGLLSEETYQAASDQLMAERRRLTGNGAPGLETVEVTRNLEKFVPVMIEFGDIIQGLPPMISQAQWALQEFGEALGDEIMIGLSAVLSGRASVKDVLRDMFARFLSDTIGSALQSLEKSIFGEGGLGGFLGGLFSKVISGRAVGGPVVPGRAYTVGAGELFQPSQAGRVLSRNDAMRAVGSGMGGPREIRVVVNGARGNQEIMEMVRQGVAQGIGQYDRVVGDRVDNNLKRRA